VSTHFIAEVARKDNAPRQPYIDRHPGLLALLEFDSMARARAWFRSAEYGSVKVKQFRRRGADSKMVLVGAS
jgi:uncharacterized protein (DUF1330 family)